MWEGASVSVEHRETLSVDLMRKLYMLYFAIEQRFLQGRYIKGAHRQEELGAAQPYGREEGHSHRAGVLWCLRRGVIKGIVGSGERG